MRVGFSSRCSTEKTFMCVFFAFFKAFIHSFYLFIAPFHVQTICGECVYCSIKSTSMWRNWENSFTRTILCWTSFFSFSFFFLVARSFLILCIHSIFHIHFNLDKKIIFAKKHKNWRKIKFASDWIHFILGKGFFFYFFDINVVISTGIF